MTHKIPNHIQALLDELLFRMRAALGEHLIGLYVFGSLVAGDFDDTVSDLDLLAAIADDLTSAQFDALDSLHNAFVTAYPLYADRLEIAYVSTHGLHTFKTEAYRIGIISPGEPFHIIDSSSGWLMNWYLAREMGKTLYGPPPQALISPVALVEFLEQVRLHTLNWPEYLADNAKGNHLWQGYAILTVSRGLYTLTHGEHPSKLQAAAWMAEQAPEWAFLIKRALSWRTHWRDPLPDPPPDMDDTRRFVDFVIARVNALRS